ncbi:MAG: hypothetical protein CSA58_05080 [Micrococcales bacterium]|nr:MAG: hypothetical protein CSA58_05080 [Micrococcales bacterium]
MSGAAPECRRDVVVYTGPLQVDRDCAHAAAAAVQSLCPGDRVVFAGPGGHVPLTAALIGNCDLYVQPGGDELLPAYRLLKDFRKVIRNHVRAGGGYLGFCLGGYLAGQTPGFGLLPGDTDQYICSPGAEVTNLSETVVRVNWQGKTRRMFFQDGPAFLVDESKVNVLARYRNGAVAALSTTFGRGRVRVCGPHPEATRDWYHGLRRLCYPHCQDLTAQLLAA